MSSLNEKLEAALDSRRRRNILRRLPEPTSPTTDPSSTNEEQQLVDFVSNDYLSLTSYQPLRTRVLSALSRSPAILGSGGSRLLVNPSGHDQLEDRLKTYFDAPAALLFNSGFDANVSLFACIPQEGDVVVYDEFVHASVHDGLRASRVVRSSGGEEDRTLIPFEHNSLPSLRRILLSLLSSPSHGTSLLKGSSSVFIAVEALYSMDGTLAPLPSIVSLLIELFPRKNAHLVVDEAHATGLYGPLGRGLVAHYGLEGCVFARLCTFGKALGSSGAVVLTSQLVKDYLLNYARPLIYTTALSCANIVAINCSFDLLEDGTTTKLANNLQTLIKYTLDLLRYRLSPFPPHLIALPPHLDLPSTSPHTNQTNQLQLHAPIIPIMTPLPRPLSIHLRNLGLNARPISWPTVPKGKDRVRVCLHAGNSKEEVERLVDGIVEWAEREVRRRAMPTGTRELEREREFVSVSVQAKL
ncbi:PLP-dependent transferase [Fomitiporia mediterranea MF3/22]|uniref:PLP-dependent transferase n=1 Tax=Fomitiporia mediterranea (strain MF3/22) TaxID=694068 RepID=UPI00044075BB|nr:PLP-dependent transferase [Fomitiporia mediterranea MF3/22]EJD06919.1 PLP-dependent transferase [Fomitiporia mediterranea MF3/22]